MNNLIVSLNGNVLKVSLATPESFASKSINIDSSSAVDTSIVDVAAFSENLSQITSELLSETKKDRIALNYLIEPQDTILKFVTVTKRDGDTDEKVLSEVREKLDGVTLEELYFSYQKIAPFVYQFVGIKKEKLEKILEVSNALGVELRSIVPWMMLLPRYIGRNEPCIFISKKDNDQIIALSELNGIYFCETYNQEKTPGELDEIVSQLSVYKRVAPITKIYSLGGEAFSLDPRYEVVPLIPQDQLTDGLVGYEVHALLNKMVGEDPNILTSQINALNMLPLPVAENKPSALIYAGASVAVFLLLGAGFLFFVRGKNTDTSADNSATDTPVVLSETNESTQTAEQPKPELKREEIKIRVENAAGISGLAAKVQTFLQDKGWVVPTIDTADESGRETTLIKVKTSKKDYLEMLSNDMKGSYEVSTEEGLDESLEYDVLVLVGSK